MLARALRRAGAALRGSVGPLVLDGYPVLRDDAPGWSAAPGDTVGFALNGVRAAEGILDVRDAGGQRVARLPARLRPQALQGAEPWRTGAGYAVTCRWAIPADLESGVYFLEGRSDLFVVVRAREPAHAPVALLISSNTFNAYSRTASASLYDHPRQVAEVSFLRPFDQVKEREWRAFVDWVGRTRPFGAAVRYLCDADLERPGALRGARVLIVLGHSEYWTRSAREAFDAHVAAGGHVVIAGGNVMKWQVRYGDGGRSLIAYKGRAFKTPAEGGDPAPEPHLKTGRWYDAQLGYPTMTSIGGDFIRGGYGAARHKFARGWNGLRVIDGAHPLLEGLGLADGDLISLGRVTELDGAPVRGLDRNGRPVPDAAAAGAERLEFLAYDWGYRGGHTLGTAHLLQHSGGSGVVLHLGAKECARSPVVQGIVRNAVRRMLAGAALFSGKAERAVAYPLTTPWKGELPAAGMS